MTKNHFGPQTEQALENFPFPTHKVHQELIYSIVRIKKAAALANKSAGFLSPEMAEVIVRACDEILGGKYDDQFVTPALQGGAGTSINMNVNEVIASLANVHPNDQVNKSQSTNDVNPSALKITVIELTEKFLGKIDVLIKSLEKKAEETKSIKKLARTHFQDATPMTVGAEFLSYAAIVKRDKKRIEEALKYFYELNLGGTAIGDSINASEAYIENVYKELNKITGLSLIKAENFMSQTSSSSDFCGLSSAINILYVDLSKMATDIRCLASGPRGGIGEYILPELQPGSSIMPGKVNPVIPESINQIHYYISGKNLSIHEAAENANLELAVMFPVIADSLISILKMATSGVEVFAIKCIDLIKINEEKCRQHLESSTAYATLLIPKLGYDAVSGLVKEVINSGETLRGLCIKKGLLSEEEFEKLAQGK